MVNVAMSNVLFFVSKGVQPVSLCSEKAFFLLTGYVSCWCIMALRLLFVVCMVVVCMLLPLMLWNAENYLAAYCG